MWKFNRNKIACLPQAKYSERLSGLFQWQVLSNFAIYERPHIKLYSMQPTLEQNIPCLLFIFSVYFEAAVCNYMNGTLSQSFGIHDFILKALIYVCSIHAHTQFSFSLLCKKKKHSILMSHQLVHVLVFLFFLSLSRS